MHNTVKLSLKVFITNRYPTTGILASPVFWMGVIMDLSSFVMKIIILLLPGILASKIYRKLRGKSNKKDWEDFTEIFLFAVMSYVIVGFFKSLRLKLHPFSISCNYSAVTTFNAFIDEREILSWDEIFLSVIIGLLLAFFASYIYRYKIINKFAQLVRASNRYGDEDVWDYFHNMSEVEWVVVRDHKVDLYYYCWIKAFSESGAQRELLLADVSVYNSDGDYLYDVDAMYLSRDYYDVTIELHNINGFPKKEPVKEVTVNNAQQ